MISKNLIRKSMIFSLIFVCSLFLSSCEDDVVVYDYEISWTPDNLDPDPDSVLLAADSEDLDELRLAVDLYLIMNGPTHGVYFDLVFRNEVMIFDGFEVGEVLEEVGNVNYQAEIDPQDPGRLIVGISLTGTQSVELADGPAVYLRFIPNRSGTCPFTFENAKIMTADNGGRTPVTGVSWFGGYAYVTQ